jgi:hypothetical protein
LGQTVEANESRFQEGSSETVDLLYVISSSIANSAAEGFRFCSKRRDGFRARRSPAFEVTNVNTSCATLVALDIKRKIVRRKTIGRQMPLFIPALELILKWQVT